MDMTTISATLASLNIASKFIKNSIEKIKDDAVREKVTEILDSIIPLQANIVSLYESNLTLIKEKETLEKKIMEIEDWQKEASRYELKELASGVYVYCIKETAKSSEPNHYLCAKCYNDRNKTILQRTSHSHAGVHYVCHSCSSEIIDHSQAKPSSYENPNWDALL